MVVLGHQGKHQRHEVALKRKPWDDPLVKRLVSGQQDVDRDFEPGAFGSLAWMIEPRQLSRLKSSFDSWISDKGNQPDALDAARVFARQAIEGALNLFQSAFRQRALILVFDTYGHRVTLGEGRKDGQVSV